MQSNCSAGPVRPKRILPRWLNQWLMRHRAVMDHWRPLGALVFVSPLGYCAVGLVLLRCAAWQWPNFADKLFSSSNVSSHTSGWRFFIPFIACHRVFAAAGSVLHSRVVQTLQGASRVHRFDCLSILHGGIDRLGKLF